VDSETLEGEDGTLGCLGRTGDEEGDEGPRNEASRLIRRFGSSKQEFLTNAADNLHSGPNMSTTDFLRSEAELVLTEVCWFK